MSYENFLKTIDWENGAVKYDDLPVWSAYFGNSILENINYRKYQTVLDIGCGTGFPTLETASRLGSTCTVYGLDPWEYALDILVNKAKIRQIKNIKVCRGYAEALPFENNFFDLIISNNGISASNNKEKSIMECGRVMKRNAELIFTIILPSSFMELYNDMAYLLDLFGIDNGDEIIDKHIHSKRKSTECYKELLEGNNFSLISSIEKSFNYYFVDGTALLNYYFFRLMFSQQWINLAGPLDKVEFFKEFERYLNEKSKSSPLICTIKFACIKARHI